MRFFLFCLGRDSFLTLLNCLASSSHLSLLVAAAVVTGCRLLGFFRLAFADFQELLCSLFLRYNSFFLRWLCLRGLKIRLALLFGSSLGRYLTLSLCLLCFRFFRWLFRRCLHHLLHLFDLLCRNEALIKCAGRWLLETWCFACRLRLLGEELVDVDLVLHS